jgi:hypothetical protein
LLGAFGGMAWPAGLFPRGRVNENQAYGVLVVQVCHFGAILREVFQPAPHEPIVIRPMAITTTFDQALTSFLQ